jgi:hypothetical protein
MSSALTLANVESLLWDTARLGAVLTYAEALAALGQGFSRPRMRALCALLDEVDRRAARNGQPELAVLVVRASDRLPGQGWWIGRPHHDAPWTGPEASQLVATLQGAAHDFWRTLTVR